MSDNRNRITQSPILPRDYCSSGFVASTINRYLENITDQGKCLDQLSFIEFLYNIITTPIFLKCIITLRQFLLFSQLMIFRFFILVFISARFFLLKITARIPWTFRNFSDLPWNVFYGGFWSTIISGFNGTFSYFLLCTLHMRQTNEMKLNFVRIYSRLLSTDSWRQSGGKALPCLQIITWTIMCQPQSRYCRLCSAQISNDPRVWIFPQYFNYSLIFYAIYSLIELLI